MGTLLAKPKIEKTTFSDKNDELLIGFSCMQGWRVEMEDAHSIVLNMEYPFNKWSFFGVYDGHNGDDTAINCSKYLLQVN